MSFPTAKTVVPEEVVRGLLGSERVRRAFSFFEERAGEIDAEHAAICEVPAPPFGESARAEVLREKFVACGLAGASIDAEGNWGGVRGGGGGGGRGAGSAHL